MPYKKTLFRVFILSISLLLWIGSGIYAIYLNKLRLEQYQLVKELRNLRRENNYLYWQISKIVNYENAKKFAEQQGYTPVKPYRVIDFIPILKGKPLIDFYFVWFGDTPSKIAKKLGIPLKVLIQYNPQLKWGYVIPGMRLIYPVSFPVVEKKSPQENKTSDANNTKTHHLVPSKAQSGNRRSNTSNKLQ